MRKFLKDYMWPIFAVIGLGFMICTEGNVYAAKINYQTWNGNGPRSGTAEMRLEGDTLGARSELQLTGDIARSTWTVAHSTSESTGTWFPCELAGSTAAVQGHLMVSTASIGNADGCRVVVSDCVTGLDQTGWVGIAVSSASLGTVVKIYTSGFVLALTTSTVNPGDTLVSDVDNDGYLKADTTPTTGADVGVALESSSGAGGLTLIRLR